MAISGISTGPSNEYIPASEPVEEEAPVAEALPEAEPEPAITPIEDSSQLNQEAIAEDSSLTLEGEDHSHVDSMLDSLGSTDNFASGETSLEATVETLEEQVESASDRQLPSEEVGERLDQAENEARKQLDQSDDPEKQAEARAQLEKIEDLQEQERDKEERLNHALLANPPQPQVGPDTRFPGDVSKPAPVEEAKAPAEDLKSETPTPKTPLEWLHQRALQALGPQAERRPAPPPAAESVQEVKPQPQPGFLASEVRKPGQPDMRLPGDLPQQARAELQPNETKTSAESPENGLKELFFGKDAQAQLASRFDDLRSQFQLAFAKSGEHQPAPLPVPAPEVRRASGEAVSRLANAEKPEGLVDSLKSLGTRAYDSVFGGEESNKSGDQGLVGSLKELGGKAYDSLFGGDDSNKAHQSGLLGTLQEWGSKAYHSVFGGEKAVQNENGGLLGTLKDWGSNVYHSVFGGDKAVQNENGGLLGTLKDWGSNVYHSVFGGDKAVQNENGGLLGTLKEWGSNVYNSVFGGGDASRNNSGGIVGTLKEWGSNVYNSVFGGGDASRNSSGGIVGTLKDWGSQVYNSVFGGDDASKNSSAGIVGTLKDWGSQVYNSVFGGGDASKNSSGGIVGTLKDWGSQVYNSVFGGGDASKTDKGGLVGTLKEWGSQAYNSVFGGGDASKNNSSGNVGTLKDWGSQVYNSIFGGGSGQDRLDNGKFSGAAKEWGQRSTEVPSSDTFGRSSLGEQVQSPLAVLSSLGGLGGSADRAVAGGRSEGLGGWAQQAARAALTNDPTSTFQGLASSAAQLATGSVRSGEGPTQLLDQLSQVAQSAASGKIDLHTALSRTAETLSQISAHPARAAAPPPVPSATSPEPAAARPAPEITAPALATADPHPVASVPKLPLRPTLVQSAPGQVDLEAGQAAQAPVLNLPPAMLKPPAPAPQLLQSLQPPALGKDSGLTAGPGPLMSTPSIGTEQRNAGGGGGAFWLRRAPEPREGAGTSLPPESSTQLASAQRLAVQPPAALTQSATPAQTQSPGDREEQAQVGERRRVSRLGRIFTPMQQDQQHEQSKPGLEREAHKSAREEREKEEKHSTKSQRQQEGEQQRKQQQQQQLQRQVLMQRQASGKKEEAARQRPRQQAGQQSKESECCGQCGHHLEGDCSACPICSASQQPVVLLAGSC